MFSTSEIHPLVLALEEQFKFRAVAIRVVPSAEMAARCSSIILLAFSQFSRLLGLLLDSVVF